MVKNSNIIYGQKGILDITTINLVFVIAGSTSTLGIFWKIYILSLATKFKIQGPDLRLLFFIWFLLENGSFIIFTNFNLHSSKSNLPIIN